ncbi:hypothetical protein RPD76_07645 [Methylomonas sp. MV1]|uniref:hypothetical protein n=1 Tax=Methylomonas sp. MV1 TaxID=3073620 RepID=UPI0028A580C1|nr:hypothetical protein [Methylomonas sp. MV1]MDT4329779.1 hypothetical protein [Methylomonas sp. MV1]
MSRSVDLHARRVRRAQIVFEAITYYAADLSKMDRRYVLVGLAEDGRLAVHDGDGRFFCHADRLSTAAAEVAR